MTMIFFFWSAVPTTASSVQPKVPNTGHPHITTNNTPKTSAPRTTQTSAPDITTAGKTQPTETSQAVTPTVHTHHEVTTQTSKRYLKNIFSLFLVND